MLIATRPTAINLKWALDEMVRVLKPLPPSERAQVAYAGAEEIAEEDVAINRDIGQHGLKLIEAIAAGKKPGGTVNILTHCNAGWLATVDWGTATSPIYLAHDRGIPVHVWVDETRPRNQGASLTAWELGHHGVPHTVIPDNTGGHLMQHRMVDLAIVGTDRVAANGDVCNKIGTYLKALAAHDNGVPFYVALPSPTIDLVSMTASRRSRSNSARPMKSRYDRAYRRWADRNGPRGSRRLADRQLRVRRDAGEAGDRADHRTRRAPARACCTCERLSRAGCRALKAALTRVASARYRTPLHQPDNSLSMSNTDIEIVVDDPTAPDADSPAVTSTGVVDVVVSLLLLALARRSAGTIGAPEPPGIHRAAGWLFSVLSLRDPRRGQPLRSWRRVPVAEGSFGNICHAGSTAPRHGGVRPTLLFCLAMQFLGLYVASFLLIAGFMRLVGKIALWKSLLTAFVFTAVMFVTFDVAFDVIMPKGPLEAAIGH